jgi:hypothetical protein
MLFRRYCSAVSILVTAALMLARLRANEAASLPIAETSNADCSLGQRDSTSVYPVALVYWGWFCTQSFG